MSWVLGDSHPELPAASETALFVIQCTIFSLQHILCESEIHAVDTNVVS